MEQVHKHYNTKYKWRRVTFRNIKFCSRGRGLIGNRADYDDEYTF